jgi:putative ABC transport system permease protein
MIRNYFKIAWRNLVKDRKSSVINIGGLAVGMAVAILIGLWIYDELSFNRNFKNYDHIAQVMQHATSNSNVESSESLPFPIGKELQTNYGSNFKYVVMSSWEEDHILSLGDKIVSKRGIYMDVDAPRMLALRMLKGSLDGLKDPHSILLTASAAKAFFGDSDPIGKPMRIDNKLDVKVTGVYQDPPFNADFSTLAFIAPWDLYVTSETWIKGNETVWDNNSFQCFVQIADHSNFAAVNRSIMDAKAKRVAPGDRKYKFEVFLHPMGDWHLRSRWENGVNTGGLIEYVWIFGIVGVFVLMLACINFMNLSTAQSEKRAKEVGIRKTIGSSKRQLIGQFYGESFLVVAFAFLVSLFFAQLMLPWFNEVANKKISMPWDNPFFWLLGSGFILFTGLVAGSYPALYLSSFQPIKVLKGTFRVGRLASLPRKVLVVLQFSISLALIIGTIIVYNQVQFAKTRPIGYDSNGLLMIRMKSPDFYGKFDLLRNDLKSSGAITELAESSCPLTLAWSNNGGFSWPGKDPNLDAEFRTIWVTHEFGQTVGWQFKEGRDFSRAFGTDSAGVLLNEAAVKFMGLKNPVGTLVKWSGSSDHAKTYKVLGVIKDMLMDSPYETVKQSIYFLDYENVNWIILKLNQNKSAAESISKIETAFKNYIPSAPFEYKFADREFETKFAAEERIRKLLTFFAVLAIFICCLGLFGLASFVAEQRTKEIGVRKVLGASVFNLWKMLSADFVLLVFISLAIATPVSYYFMQNWLQNYQYRDKISWQVFAITGMGALILTLLTISFQSIKAAMANPVKSLRNE